MPLMQLIYVSSAVEEWSSSVLDEILTSSVSHNTPQHITGMLLYFKGSFMQVIEGEEAAINETYDRICKDPRHRNIYLLSRETIAQREFPNWAMGFRRLNGQDVELNPAYAPFFSEGFDTAQPFASSGVAMKMLKNFAQN